MRHYSCIRLPEGPSRQLRQGWFSRTESASPQAGNADCTHSTIRRFLEPGGLTATLAGADGGPCRAYTGRYGDAHTFSLRRLPGRPAGGHAGAALRSRHGKEHVRHGLLRDAAHRAAPCELRPRAAHHRGVPPGLRRRAAVRTGGAAWRPPLDASVPGSTCCLTLASVVPQSLPSKRMQPGFLLALHTQYVNPSRRGVLSGWNYHLQLEMLVIPGH